MCPASHESMFNLKRQTSTILPDITSNILDEQRQKASMLKGYRFIITALVFFIPGKDAKHVHCSWSCLPREWEEKNYSAAVSNNSCSCGKKRWWFTPSHSISNFLLVQFCLFFPTRGLVKSFKGEQIWLPYNEWAGFCAQFSELLHVTAMLGVDLTAPGRNTWPICSADFLKVSERRTLLQKLYVAS